MGSYILESLSANYFGGGAASTSRAKQASFFRAQVASRGRRRDASQRGRRRGWARGGGTRAVATSCAAARASRRCARERRTNGRHRETHCPRDDCAQKKHKKTKPWPASNPTSAERCESRPDDATSRFGRALGRRGMPLRVAVMCVTMSSKMNLAEAVHSL